MTPQKLNDIHTIVIHCSATRETDDISAKDIDRMHRDRGWSMIGYHRVIRLDGTIQPGRPLERRGAHVKGNNTNTVGVCLVGGLDVWGHPKDTYTDQQWHALLFELTQLLNQLPNVKKICGHRDFSPDLNGDGLITPDEWVKQCPCFDVGEKLANWRLGYLA